MLRILLGSGVLALSLATVAQAEPRRARVEGPRRARVLAEQPPAATKTRSADDLARRAQVLARVGSSTVTIGMLEDQLAGQSALARARRQGDVDLKALLDKLIRFELLADEAERRGYGDNPAVVRTLKESAVQSLVRKEIDEQISPQSIGQEEVRAYYEEHRSEFERPAMRRASHILVDTEQEAKALLEQARAADSQQWAELARKHSKDLETRLRGGDLGYFPASLPGQGRRREVHDALREAAFALKTLGDVVERPIALEGRFSILRLTGERPGQTSSLEQAEPAIRTRLWREKRQAASDALIARLRAQEKPEVHADLVDLVKLDDMERPGPARAKRAKKRGKKRNDLAGAEEREGGDAP